MPDQQEDGGVYAYESVSHWDKEKRQSRSRRWCLGRVDPATGKIIPTRKRRVPVGKEGKRTTVASRLFYRATYLLDRLGEETGVVLDRGFFSVANINDMYSRHLKFLIAATLPLKLVETHLDPVREKIALLETRSPGRRALCLYHPHPVKPYAGPTPQGRNRHGGPADVPSPVLLPRPGPGGGKSLHGRLALWQEELAHGRRHPDHEAQYAQYFDVKRTPVRGTEVVVKEEVLAEAKRNNDYFALLSNKIRDPMEALTIYRNKDMVEKTFDNLKERLNLRRSAVS